MFTWLSTWRAAGVAVIVGVAVAGAAMLSEPAQATRDERLCRIAEKYLDKEVPQESAYVEAVMAGNHRAAARVALRLRDNARAAQQALKKHPAASPASRRARASLLKMFVLHEKAAQERYLSRQHAVRGELADAGEHELKALKLTEQDTKLRLIDVCKPG